MDVAKARFLSGTDEIIFAEGIPNQIGCAGIEHTERVRFEGTANNTSSVYPAASFLSVPGVNE